MARSRTIMSFRLPCMFCCMASVVSTPWRRLYSAPASRWSGLVPTQCFEALRQRLDNKQPFGGVPNLPATPASVSPDTGTNSVRSEVGARVERDSCIGQCYQDDDGVPYPPIRGLRWSIPPEPGVHAQSAAKRCALGPVVEDRSSAVAAAHTRTAPDERVCAALPKFRQTRPTIPRNISRYQPNRGQCR